MNNSLLCSVMRAFIISAFIITVSGCGTTVRYTSQENNRYWDCKYFEDYTIQTEPNGGRIYVQDELKGDSPVKGTVGGYKFKMTQNGETKIAYDWDNWNGRTTNYRPVGEANWNKLKTEDEGNTFYYTVKAFKAGYMPVERRIEINTQNDVFLRSIEGATVNKEGRMQSEFRGMRRILLALQPVGNTNVSQEKTQPQQQQQQQTVVLPGTVNIAKGTVLVSSSPENGDIYLDGIYVGNTPTKLSLKEGIHIIEVKKDGLETFKRELRVLADSDLSFRAILK